jgi:hypothetical protein
LTRTITVTKTGRFRAWIRDMQRGECVGFCLTSLLDHSTSRNEKTASAMPQ